MYITFFRNIEYGGLERGQIFDPNFSAAFIKWRSFVRRKTVNTWLYKCLSNDLLISHDQRGQG